MDLIINLKFKYSHTSPLSPYIVVTYVKTNKKSRMYGTFDQSINFAQCDSPICEAVWEAVGGLTWPLTPPYSASHSLSIWPLTRPPNLASHGLQRPPNSASHGLALPTTWPPTASHPLPPTAYQFGSHTASQFCQLRGCERPNWEAM